MLQTKFRKTALLAALLSALSGSALADGDDAGQGVYHELYNLDQDTERSKYVDGIKANNTDEIRLKAMRETAVTLGMQAGVRYRYNQINDELEYIALQLDEIFNFKPLLIGGGMLLPPIIDHVEGGFSLESNDLINQSDATYMLRKDARLVSTAPSWRDYLKQQFSVLDNVNKVMLPKDDEEKAFWQSAVLDGWNKGIQQADNVFTLNLNKLKRDYLGISTFHSLARQNIVAMPALAVGDMGVSINGRTMDVGQKIFRITRHAEFNNSTGWRVIGSASN